MILPKIANKIKSNKNFWKLFLKILSHFRDINQIKKSNKVNHCVQFPKYLDPFSLNNHLKNFTNSKSSRKNPLKCHSIFKSDILEIIKIYKGGRKKNYLIYFFVYAWCKSN